MNINVEKQPACTATLSADFPADKVNKERKSIVKAYAKEAKIPGFRPGKTPLSVIEKRFADGIKEELESRLINEACQEAIKKDEDLKVLRFNNPEKISHNEDGSFSIILPIILAPTFELPEYKEIEVKIPSSEPTEEELTAELNQLLERYADFKDIEDRPLQAGDIAIIDFSTKLDGKPIKEALGKPVGILEGKEDYWIKLENDSFLPGFSEQLEGVALNEEKEITSSVADDFPLEDLQGKDLLIDVKVKGIKEMTLPELNDEFVSKKLQFGDDQTVDDLKKLISEQITYQKKQQIDESKVNQIVEELINRVDFELPEELLASEAQGNADDMVSRGAQAGLSDEQIAEQQEEIIKNAEIQARNNLKTNFILQEIAMKEELSITQPEMMERITAMAKQDKKPVKAFIKELQKNGRIGNIENSMIVGKAIDFLVDNAKIEEIEAEKEA